MPESSSDKTTLTIRNVDASLKEQLRIRAAHRGHSMEAELRSILKVALDTGASQGSGLAAAIHRRFAALGGVELEPHPPLPIDTPPDFGA